MMYDQLTLQSAVRKLRDGLPLMWSERQALLKELRDAEQLKGCGVLPCNESDCSVSYDCLVGG